MAVLPETPHVINAAALPLILARCPTMPLPQLRMISTAQHDRGSCLSPVILLACNAQPRLQVRAEPFRNYLWPNRTWFVPLAQGPARISAVKSATGRGSLPGRLVRRRANASIWDDLRYGASSSVAATQTPAANMKYGVASHWDCLDLRAIRRLTKISQQLHHILWKAIVGIHTSFQSLRCRPVRA